jgi:hypothetical protein
MNRDELMTAVRAWLEETPGADVAADWLLDRAEAAGEIPKQPTLDVSVTWQEALASFLSARFVRLSDRGRKFTIYFDEWEREQFGESGVVLPILAEVRCRTLISRKRQRQDREMQIRELLQGYSKDAGLPGYVARSELEKLELRQGRFWSRSSHCSAAEMEREVGRYFKLLRHGEGLRKDAARIERIVHVSRVVAGDTHWLRPGNRIWRDLSEDVLNFDVELKERLCGLERREILARALAEIGIVENLTSVVVMVFGHFGLQRGSAFWNWPKEAARERLPIWLTAVHLKDSRVVPDAPITQIVSVENETSFLDLVGRHADDTGVVLIYTEGQANRAVIALLRLLSVAAPAAQLRHQGDLDVPGVRILASLCQRSGLHIHPEYMDADTHRQLASSGIELSEAEYNDVMREVAAGRLPCGDLLQEIAATKLRIEQETLTADCRSGG